MKNPKYPHLVIANCRTSHQDVQRIKPQLTVYDTLPVYLVIQRNDFHHYYLKQYIYSKVFIKVVHWF